MGLHVDNICTRFPTKTGQPGSYVDANRDGFRDKSLSFGVTSTGSIGNPFACVLTFRDGLTGDTGIYQGYKIPV
jgi:hypothetical protein